LQAGQRLGCRLSGRRDMCKIRNESHAKKPFGKTCARR
jgi:hypothetical protein